MATLPSALSLTNIADGALAVAADERNNFAAIQTATNQLLTILGAGSTGQFFTGNGTTVSMSYPPGFEVGYDQITANVTVSSSTEATGTTVITAASHVFDGSPVIAEFFTPSIVTFAGVNAVVVPSLFEGATQIGRFGVVNSLGNATGYLAPLYGRIRFTPSAASHTYTVTAFQTGGNGTIQAGAGGTAVQTPTFVRFTKV